MNTWTRRISTASFVAAGFLGVSAFSAHAEGPDSAALEAIAQPLTAAHQPLTLNGGTDSVLSSAGSAAELPTMPSGSLTVPGVGTASASENGATLTPDAEAGDVAAPEGSATLEGVGTAGVDENGPYVEAEAADVPELEAPSGEVTVPGVGAGAVGENGVVLTPAGDATIPELPALPGLPGLPGAPEVPGFPETPSGTATLPGAGTAEAGQDGVVFTPADEPPLPELPGDPGLPDVEAPAGSLVVPGVGTFEASADGVEFVPANGTGPGLPVLPLPDLEVPDGDDDEIGIPGGEVPELQVPDLSNPDLDGITVPSGSVTAPGVGTVSAGQAGVTVTPEAPEVADIEAPNGSADVPGAGSATAGQDGISVNPAVGTEPGIPSGLATAPGVGSIQADAEGVRVTPDVDGDNNTVPSGEGSITVPGGAAADVDSEDGIQLTLPDGDSVIPGSNNGNDSSDGGNNGTNLDQIREITGALGSAHGLDNAAIDGLTNAGLGTPVQLAPTAAALLITRRSLTS